MRFEPSEQAVALRDAVEGHLRAVTPDLVRAGWADPADTGTRRVWQRLADAGFVGTLIDSRRGGIGLDDEALVHALEAIGYSGLPVPAVETVAVAAPLLAAAGRDELADVLAGRAVVTAGAHQGDGDLLAYAAGADLALLGDGGGWRLSRIGDLELDPVASVDGARHVCRVRAVRVGVPVDVDPAEAARATLRASLGTAALLVGLARRMLDLTSAYVRERRQFGAPVGSFQAIKHHLASALVSLSFARPPVSAAAWALTHGTPDAAAQVSMAKAMASEAALQVARVAIQCHGAIGYTTEYDLHLFVKRAWALAPAWGDPRTHRARLAEHLGLAARLPAAAATKG